MNKIWVRQIQEGELCDFPGIEGIVKGQKPCTKPATVIISCDEVIKALCDEHAALAEHDQMPEYTVTCPCCGCRIFVS